METGEADATFNRIGLHQASSRAEDLGNLSTESSSSRIQCRDTTLPAGIRHPRGSSLPLHSQSYSGSILLHGRSSSGDGPACSVIEKATQPDLRHDPKVVRNGHGSNS